MMILVLIIATVVCFLGLLDVPRKLCVEVPNPLSKEITASINGFFIIIVFLSHVRQYVDPSNYTSLDTPFIRFMVFFGQLCVTTFLFYSGYGAMESIRRKPGYIHSFPLRRILPFMIDVAIAIAVYSALKYFRGGDLSVQQTILALVGWASVGNSNWYIFSILCMWLATYLSFKVFSSERLQPIGIAGVFLLTALYSKVMIHEGVGTRFYNTIYCYPAGMVLSYCIGKASSWNYRERLKGYSIVLELIALCALMALFYKAHRLSHSSITFYNIQSIIMVLGISLVCSRMRYTSSILNWIGANLFYFYIYQRVPMVVLQKSLADNSPVYLLACIVVLLPLCLLMMRVHALVKRFLFEEDARNAPRAA